MQVEQQPEQYSLLENALSDSSNTTTTQSSSPHPNFSSRLHLFEWWHPDPPSRSHWLNPGPKIQNPDVHPKELSYVSLHVISTVKKEALRSPGRRTRNVPELVPSLSAQVKDCARNGVLIDPLAGARIESGKDWAQRTIIQGWNGYMYFNLPSLLNDTDGETGRGLGSMYPDERDLATIYKEWKQRRRLERKTYSGTRKSDPRLRKFRVDQQRGLVKSIYEISRWHPEYIGFLPAYLGAPQERPDDVPTSRRSIDALFYIILEDEQLPSYFFWAEKEEWCDPTESNLAFEEYENIRARRRLSRSSDSRSNIESRSLSLRRLSSFSSQQRSIRVKISPAPRKFLLSTKVPTTSRYRAAVWAIERDLYNNGFEATLRKYQKTWFDDGKNDEWVRLTRVLRRQLPPAGFPRHPPVTDLHDPSMISVAEKMARVHAPSPSHPILPIFIHDDWTRSDDAYWTIRNSDATASPPHDNAVPRARFSAASLTSPQSFPQNLSRRTSDVCDWISRASSLANADYRKACREGNAPRDADIALCILTDKTADSGSAI